jgi:hypothetical protein
MFGHEASGEWQGLTMAMSSLDLTFEWEVDFLVVERHARPIPSFCPKLILATCLAECGVAKVWPAPPRKNMGRCHGRGIARGGGRGRARGLGRGRVADAAVVDDDADGFGDAPFEGDVVANDIELDSVADDAANSEGSRDECDLDDLGSFLADIADPLHGVLEEEATASGDAREDMEAPDTTLDPEFGVHPDNISDGLGSMGGDGADEGLLDEFGSDVAVGTGAPPVCAAPVAAGGAGSSGDVFMPLPEKPEGDATYVLEGGGKLNFYS